MPGLTSSVNSGNHIAASAHKFLTGQVMVGSHVLPYSEGQSLPWVIPVYCYASRITCLWNVRVIFFSRLLGRMTLHTRAPEHKTHCYFVGTPSLFTVNTNYVVPTNVKEVCISPFCFLFNSRSFPILLSPIFLNLPPGDFM